MSQLHNELKKEFQLERMILFSDAVFAIAITLLVIELKVPEIDRAELTEKKLLQAVAHLIPKFFGFIVSFMFIGIYWTVHHRLFGYVVNYTPKLLRLNMFFLFAVALMPFSTAFYSEYVMKHVLTPVFFYTGNIILLGVFNLLLWRHISNPKNKLSEGLSQTDSKYYSMRAIVVPAMFTLFAFIYLVNPFVSSFLPIFVPLVMRLIKKQYDKKNKIIINETTQENGT
ncbi:MAG TPA: TMEM175 family protein [Ferruginibacter sp.]|nr:TMEM175 family protein [Ferruginibacter sp.]